MVAVAAGLVLVVVGAEWHRWVPGPAGIPAAEFVGRWAEAVGAGKEGMAGVFYLKTDQIIIDLLQISFTDYVLHHVNHIICLLAPI